MSTKRHPVVVIGLGNPLMGDDGVGIAALERLRARFVLPAGIELVDGGTWGLNLLPVIEDADGVILIDAIDTGAPPGTLVRLEHASLPRYLATKISPHQVDLRDVLGLAELRGTLPSDTVAIGVQPQNIELGDPLSPMVARKLDMIVAAVLEDLARRGYPADGLVSEALHA
jgi:hydrogenase maturation protease